MPFTLLVCGDLFSEKVNLELSFPEKPKLLDLLDHVQNSFTAEMRCLQPPNMPAIEQFNVNRIQVYDDAHLKWVDLSSPEQLHDYGQLYCFQPDSSWQSDVQQDLPAPRPPTQPEAFSPGGDNSVAGPFTLLVCGDLISEKVNMELSFPKRPTLSELKKQVKVTFTLEMQITQQPPNNREFDMDKTSMQVYDDVHLKWVDLSSPEQLHYYGQVCFYQPGSKPWWEGGLPMPRLLSPMALSKADYAEPFTLFVCGDLFSEKVNLELQFPEKPTLPELKNHVQNSFTAEMRCLQPPNMPAIEQFNVNRIQVIDDAHLKWVDLSSPQQLHDYGQLYCFQPDSSWQTDVQKDLPAPRPPTQPEAFSPGGDNSVAGPFTLLVCGDLISEKVNMELSFPKRPTLSELKKQVKITFTLEMQITQQLPNNREFDMDKTSMQVYDVAHLKWVDLSSPEQLHCYGQVCFYQPGSKPWWKGDLPTIRPVIHPMYRSKAVATLPFTLLVCADLSEKVNLKLVFPEKPTLVEFKREAEITLTAELLCLQPQLDPRLVEPFNAVKIQILDDMKKEWVNLSSPKQLHEYAQLYCYQPVSSWPIDSDQKMPLPRPPLAVPWQCGGDVVTQPPMNNIAAPVQQKRKSQKSPKLKGAST